jgi:hypothetical protein
VLQLPGELPVVGVEHVLELPLEVLRNLAGLVGELGLHLARRALELRLHELRVRAGLLPVEHARPDLDRLADGLDGVLPASFTLANETNRAFVLDDETVDGEAVADRSDLGLPEGCRCFHDWSVAP